MSESGKTEDDSTPGGLSVASIEDEDEALARIVEVLPAEQKAELISIVRSHRGWLPPPDMLAAYEQIVPGLAERIVRMPEREQQHRHAFIDNEGNRRFTLKRWGQHYALLSLLLLLGFAVFLTLIGQPAWGSRVAIFTIAAVVGIFVTGKVADVKIARDDSE